MYGQAGYPAVEKLIDTEDFDEVNDAFEEAYAELQDPRFKDVTSRRAQRLLAAREQWFDALGDPEIPEALLDLYRARHMDRSIPLPELESIPDARQGALAIRARYPDLLAADPGVLKPLLAAKLGERLGREARLDQSRLKGKAGVGIGVLIFIIIASFRLLRHCDVLETDEPEKESKGREPITAPEEPLIGIGGGD